MRHYRPAALTTGSKRRYLAVSGGMVDFVLVSYLVAVAVSLAVGLPTTLRSLRRRDTPLVLLGLAVSIDGLEWLAWTLASYTPAYETPLGDALSIASRIGISVSAVFIMSFTRLAFRPGSRIAIGTAISIPSSVSV